MNIDINSVTEEMMTSGDKFIFGNGYTNFKNEIFSWSADKPETQNGHMLIIGGSGSGKTRLLKKIVENLKNRQKQVYIIDFHGDISVPNETCYKFSLRNSQYGLNPFELELDVDNGGPIAQANIVLSNFKKNFIPNIGAVQKSVLKRFLIDCYRYVGILDEDSSTWSKAIPSVSTMLELYTEILTIINSSSGHSIQKHLSKLAKLKRDREYETNPEKQDSLQKRLDNEVEKFNLACSRYNDYLLLDKYTDMFNINISPHIDTDFYLEDKASKAFSGLSPYLSELGTSSVFNDNKPPKAKGVVRYDISGFTNVDKPSEAMFFADTVIQKIFRAVKMRGEYRKLGKRGKADTFIVIDESKLILPTGKDKENPYNILNRIVTESRKYGMALIIVSQRPDHFPEEMLSSIYTKIVLKINENDVKAAMKSLGIKDVQLFQHLNSKNVALIGHTGGLFQSVQLAYNTSSR
jgi:GTPase SAR1 family protein